MVSDTRWAHCPRHLIQLSGPISNISELGVSPLVYLLRYCINKSMASIDLSLCPMGLAGEMNRVKNFILVDKTDVNKLHN